MHDAYIVLAPTKIPVQIESIVGYENNVILGTRQGHLLMYSVQPNPTGNKMELQLLQYEKNFSKKPIVQIDVVPEYQLLFSLSDNVVNVNDINRHNFPMIDIASKTKGATVFTLDVKRPTSLTGETALFVRMCVAVKRKLQFWYWKHDKLLELANDINLNDIPKTLAWTENTVCVGFKTEYVLYDTSGTERKLFPTSSSRTIDPCIAIIGTDIFGVAKDEFLIAVDPNSNQDLNKMPSAQVQNKEEFSSLNPEPRTKGFKSLAWSHPLQMLVWDEPYVVALVNDVLEVRILDSSGDSLIQTLNDLQKARLLIRARQGLLFVASVSHLWCIQSVDIPKQRQNLLKQKKFQLALQLTNISDESKEDKEDKIYNIQTRYAYDLFENKQFVESMKEFSKLKTEPCDVIRLYPGLFPQDGKNSASADTKTGNELEGKDLENALSALVDYLTEVRYNLKKELLNKSDSKPFGKTSTTLRQIIETTLLKCYLQTNDSLVAPLLRLNSCHLEESERTLKQYHKYSELIILYQTNGLHKKALQVLQAQAQIPGSCLFGYDRTIQYLQELGQEHLTLIFEFAGWVIENHPEDGLKIFTEDIQEVENLPRARVLDHLLMHHKSLVVPYLEHVIHVWKEPKPFFNNLLIKFYLEKIKELQQDIACNSAGSEKTKEILLDSLRAKLLDFLKKSSKYNPETVLNYFPYHDLFQERAVILGKLGHHEKVFAIYIQILGDIDTAINYCVSVYNEKWDSKENEVFLLLIRTLLKPPKTPPYNGVDLHPKCLEPDTEAVLEILDKHGMKINPHAVLQILPDHIPLWRLKTFLEISLHHQLEKKRKTQVLKGLLYAEHLQLQEQKLYYESKNVLVTDFSACVICNKKFSNQSAFVRRPNGVIVHFACQDKV